MASRLCRADNGDVDPALRVGESLPTNRIPPFIPAIKCIFFLGVEARVLEGLPGVHSGWTGTQRLLSRSRLWTPLFIGRESARGCVPPNGSKSRQIARLHPVYWGIQAVEKPALAWDLFSLRWMCAAGSVLKRSKGFVWESLVDN